MKEDRAENQASRRNKRVKDCSRQVMRSPWSVHLTKPSPPLPSPLSLHHPLSSPFSISPSSSSPSYPHLHLSLLAILFYYIFLFSFFALLSLSLSLSLSLAIARRLRLYLGIAASFRRLITYAQERRAQAYESARWMSGGFPPRCPLHLRHGRDERQ